MTIRKPTHLVVDGSNIATEGRSAPSLAQLDDAVRAILAEFPHDQWTVVVDATFGHRIDEAERAAYEEAILAGELIAPPAGAVGRGDAFILQVAEKAGATVFSNDSFQEFHGEHDWLFDEGRLIGGKPVPGVGWVFVNRVPVRGPASRRAVRDSRHGRGSRTATAKSTAKAARSEPAPSPSVTVLEAATAAPGAGLAAGTAIATKAKRPRARRRGGAKGAASPEAAPAAPAARAPAAEPLNEPAVFLAFITRHRIGSVLEAVVDHFASHGAYVVADGARCYLPTKTMGDPPPTRARDLIARGDRVRVEVQSLDAQRRGINVRFIEVVARAERAAGEPTVERDRRADAHVALTSADDTAGQRRQPRSDSDVATSKSAARRTVKKATSDRAATKKAAAKKASPKAAAQATPSPRAARAAAKKAPAAKTTARKASATKATATKAAAAKASARKASATKATATKASAAKASAAKATAKATARRANATKATAKATATKAAAGKATARKATATKAAAAKASAATTTVASTAATAKARARKATAAKAPARKAPARKAPARKATAGKAAAAQAPSTRSRSAR
jgi:hypothetical protein